ncbi:MAG: hypothetical protein QOF45_374 [Gaiellaceae bacterium]|jgi:CHASE2 domain-containing sensor protein|nr:hypothetical protein [Gaiellaceae bacterium]
MRGLTAASQPRLLYGGTGVLLVVLGVALAVANHDWIPLIFAALGALFIGLGVIAERRSRG